jgi:type VI secretion system protein ImpL
MGLSKEVTRIVLAGIGIASIASLVYFAGPFITIGNYRPFDSYIVREIAVVLLVAAAASLGGFKFYRRKKNAAALASGVSESVKRESDETVL